MEFKLMASATAYIVNCNYCNLQCKQLQIDPKNSANAEAMGSNPVEVLKDWGGGGGVDLQLLKMKNCNYHCDNLLFTSICISRVHIIFIQS